jgi:predicted transcriptional regulator
VFQGSLPAFVAAFTRGKKLKQEEAQELLQLIQDAEEE